MPSYDFKCERCNKVHVINCSVIEYNNNEECPDCGLRMNRVFTPINPISKCDVTSGKSK